MKLYLSLALALVFTSSACSQKSKPTVSPEAAALLARADQPGTSGSLVIDVQGMRETGLFGDSSESKANLVNDLLLYTLPSLAVAMKDEDTGPLVARGAVLAGILREWNVWPQVLRVGVVVPALNPLAGPEALAEGTLMVLAVQGDAKVNLELLQGLAASDRVGGKPLMALKGEDLCLAEGELPLAVCIRSGPGYFALGTPASLDASAKPTDAAASAVGPVPLLRLRASMPGMGKAELVLEAKGGLRVAATVEADKAEMVDELEKALAQGLKSLDDSRVQARTVLSPTLDQTRQALKDDAQAPAGMKKAADGLTVDKLLDPDGNYAALRESIKVARNGQVLTAELSIPKRQLEQFTKGSGTMATVATVGVLAAIAVPNYVRFQCRSKQSEAKSYLRGAYVAQRSHQAETDRFGDSFEEIGFEPPEPGLYTYCMRGQCLACSKPGCARLSPQKNPCVQLTETALAGEGEMPIVCAVAQLGSDPEQLDVWVLEESGRPENQTNGCE